jgi:hypothetical protein
VIRVGGSECQSDDDIRATSLRRGVHMVWRSHASSLLLRGFDIHHAVTVWTRKSARKNFDADFRRCTRMHADGAERITGGWPCS